MLTYSDTNRQLMLMQLSDSKNQGAPMQTKNVVAKTENKTFTNTTTPTLFSLGLFNTTTNMLTANFPRGLQNIHRVCESKG